ncbi:MAG: hypothetical protein MUQ96_12860 [Loktanella sp.]|jgi:hypothetical protein|nr:hypothetical protein [Loktanella sp.]MDO7622405.1 hypothetical protein [Loktanella sp.]MDO7626076.1 hypothetical protein [Loktanella sp.]MDO7664292.1 hypothetical protein [Loktanella sp.]MDO7724004.1 hypothetical protein [Loktanella sp.]
MTGDMLDIQIAEVRKLMETQLRCRGKTLHVQVRKAGRLLPRNMRRDAVYLAQAETVMHHPKLSRMVDVDKAAKAHGRLVDFLSKVDPKDRAKGVLLAWLGSLAFAAIVVFIIVVTVMVKRGIV